MKSKKKGKTKKREQTVPMVARPLIKRQTIKQKDRCMDRIIRKRKLSIHKPEMIGGGWGQVSTYRPEMIGGWGQARTVVYNVNTDKSTVVNKYFRKYFKNKK